MKGAPSFAIQKFAQSMKKKDQDFAPVRVAIDKTSELDQKVFTLEYLEQTSKSQREQIEWLESKTAAKANPKWKQELHRHLKEYKDQYSKWEAEFQQLKSQLR